MSTPSRRRIPHSAVLAAWLLVAALVSPQAVLAAEQSWSISRSPTSVPAAVATDVTITVRNTSSDDSGGKSIACVRIAIPSAFVVVSTSVASVSRGFSWSVSSSGSGPTVVEARALDDSHRLRGDPYVDEARLTIRVLGAVPGIYTWVADEYEKPDCSQDHDQPKSFSVGINSVPNNPPVAANDAYGVQKNVRLTVDLPGVLANDTDADGDLLAATVQAGPTSGTLALELDGSFTYDPTPGFTGTDSFTYQVSDGSHAATATATLTVSNTPPTAVDDGYAATKNLPLVVGSGSGVLANDGDANGDSLSAGLVSGPANGTVLLGAGGGFTYVPGLGFTGTDSFSYAASDGSATTTATVTIGVSNTAPAAADDSGTTNRNGTLTVGAPGVLANDSDANGDALAAVLVAGPSNGSLSLAADGSYAYTPTPGYVGPDSFTYRASDGSAQSAPATVDLVVANTAPNPGADSHDVAKNLSLAVAAPGVLGDDVDPDGDTLTAGLVSGPAAGSLSLAPDGSFTYTPNAGFTGTDTFVYEASDGLATATATVSLNVANTAPAAADDVYAASRNLALTIPASSGVLANDNDANGDPLVAILAAAPASGTVSLAPDGSFTYTPTPGFLGTDVFTYRAGDGDLAATGTVSINVVNAVPTAVDDSHSTPRHVPLVVAAPGVLANDSDPNGDPLAAILVSGPANGTLSLAADGSFSYSPNPGFTGSDSFAYRASDGDASAVATVTIGVANSNPVAADDSASVTRNGSLVVAAPGVLANDGDPNGDPLTAVLVAGPSHGTLALAPDGGWTYTPAAGYAGADAFTYRASDGIATSVPATVSLSVVNRAPVGVPESYATDRDASLSVPATGVLANDVDLDGDGLVASLASAALHGSISLAADGSFIYTPPTGWSGVDAFTYRASDGLEASAAVTVTIVVVAPSPAPSPAPTASPTPTPAPSPTPEPTPTPDPTPTPTPEPDPGPTPTPDPTPLPEPTPSATPPAPSPSPDPRPSGVAAPAFSVPGGGDGSDDGSGTAAATSFNLAAASLGALGAFLFFVPGLVLSVPGLLLVLAIGAQVMGGLAWLPLIRRKIGRFGLRPERPA